MDQPSFSKTPVYGMIDGHRKIFCFFDHPFTNQVNP